MALPFLVLYLTQGRGWRAEDAGAALLVYGAGALSTAPFSGRLADRWGHLRVLKASLWASSGAMMLLPFANMRWALYLLIFAWAAFTQAFSPSAMALLASLADPRQRKAVFSLQRLAVNLGMSVGPALGGIIAHQSYAWVFWTDGLTTLAAAALMCIFPFVHATPAASGAGTPSSAWRDHRLGQLLLGFLMVLLVFTQIEGALPLWVVKDLDLGNPFFGLLFTVNTLAIVTLEVPLNLRMAKWTHGQQMLMGSSLYAAGFGLTQWATTRTHLVGVVLVWTFGEMILLPAVGDAVATLAPPDRRGEYMGLHAATFAAAFTLGPWLGVLTYARLGPSWVWAGGFTLAALGGVLLGRFKALQS
jgi:predicted MFS family arabinose efflux permease